MFGTVDLTLAGKEGGGRDSLASLHTNKSRDLMRKQICDLVEVISKDLFVNFLGRITKRMSSDRPLAFLIPRLAGGGGRICPLLGFPE